MRTGYLASDSSLWPALLASILRRAEPTWSQRYTAAWHRAIGGLSRSDTAAFLHSLLTVLDQRLHAHSAPLFTAAEVRSATEGLIFIGSTAAEARRAARALLELFLGARSSSTAEATSDSEDEEDAASELLVELAFGSNARRGAGVTWRPATALVLAQLAHKTGCAATLAEKAIGVWGDDQRIPRDTFDRALCEFQLCVHAQVQMLTTSPTPRPHYSRAHSTTSHASQSRAPQRRLGTPRTSRSSRSANGHARR